MSRNTLVFTDANIDALPQVEKMYSNPDAIRFGQYKGKLKMRVGRETKSFVLHYDGQRHTLGNFCPSYGVSNAIAEAYEIVSGQLHYKPRIQSDTFEKLSAIIFDEKEAKGRVAVDQSRRKFYRNVPEYILKKPVHKICREDVVLWRREFLGRSTAGYWNKVIEVPNMIWNECARTHAFTALENKTNPFSNMKEEVAKRIYPIPSFTDLKYIWRAVNEHQVDYVAMMTKLKILTGMHYSEMCKLQKRHIQGDWIIFDVGQHKISNIRNQVRHKIFMIQPVKELVNAWCKVNDIRDTEQPLFVNSLFTIIDHRTFNGVWKRAMRKADLDFRFDRLRHTLITQMIQDDIPSKYLTGHCYLENTQTKHYTDWDSDAVKSKFISSATHWQNKVYALVKDQWLYGLRN